MAIITIFGSTFGDDDVLAESVAKTLGYPCVSREILVEASRRCDVPEARLDEILEKEPHWWARWQENLRPYRIALQAGMCEVALHGDLVYHGHVGHGLLPGIRHVLKVLVTAPMEFRTEQVRARHGLDPRAARRYIDHVEKARTRRLMALFGTDWRDPGQYALILNMAQMSSATAQKMIARAALLGDYQPTAASRQALGDLTLVARVQVALLRSPSTRSLTIDVRANQGEVYLSGIITQSISLEAIRRLVETVPGVSKVTTDFVNIPSRALSRA